MADLNNFFSEMFSSARHLVLGLVDGGVSALSVLTTSYFIGDFNGVDVFKICLSVSIANLASNFGGGYLAEDAEHGKHQRNIERAMGVKRGYLDETFFQSRLSQKTLSRALTYGGASVFGIILAAIPLLLFPMPFAYFIAIGTDLILLLLVGFFIGKISSKNILYSILKVVTIALLVFILNWLVGVV